MGYQFNLSCHVPYKQFAPVSSVRLEWGRGKWPLQHSHTGYSETCPTRAPLEQGVVGLIPEGVGALNVLLYTLLARQAGCY